MQKNTKIVLGVVLIIILVALASTYYFSTRDEAVPQNQNQTQNQQPGDVLQANTQTINAQHSFQNGKHIIAGEVTVPTPCDALDVQATVAESFPEQVRLAFTTTNSSEVCIQVTDNRRFKIEFDASEDAMIRATWNGEQVNLNLTRVPQSQLENFSIFIKG